MVWGMGSWRRFRVEVQERGKGDTLESPAEGLLRPVGQTRQRRQRVLSSLSLGSCQRLSERISEADQEEKGTLETKLSLEKQKKQKTCSGAVFQRERPTMSVRKTAGTVGLRVQQENIAGDAYCRRSRQQRKDEYQNEASLLFSSFSPLGASAPQAPQLCLALGTSSVSVTEVIWFVSRRALFPSNTNPAWHLWRLVPDGATPCSSSPLLPSTHPWTS